MNPSYRIIGISGTNGSGKDTLGEILAERHGWFFVSVSELLRHEAGKRGLAIERENLRKISAEWRRQFGHGILMDKAVEEFKLQKVAHKGLAIANLRNPGEADEIHRLGGKVVWVDADPKVRYARIEARLRGPEDHKTFEQFMQEEHDEMYNYTDDDAKLNMAAVKDKADIFIENNSNLEAFIAAVEKALQL